MLLELLATEKISVHKILEKLEKQFGPHHYGRIDTHFPLEKRGALMEFSRKIRRINYCARRSPE